MPGDSETERKVRADPALRERRCCIAYEKKCSHKLSAFWRYKWVAARNLTTERVLPSQALVSKVSLSLLRASPRWGLREKKEVEGLRKRIRLVLAVLAAMVMMAVIAPSAFAAIPTPEAGVPGVLNAADTQAPIEAPLQCSATFECSRVLIPSIPGVAGNPGPP